MISTQPGSTSLSSFKIISLEEEIPKSNHGNDIGPFGDQDDEQVRDTALTIHRIGHGFQIIQF